MHWDHEPSTERSADSLVRESWKFGSRGHGCPRSWQWFMESLHSLLHMHWYHEPVQQPWERRRSTRRRGLSQGIVRAAQHLVPETQQALGCLPSDAGIGNGNAVTQVR